MTDCTCGRGHLYGGHTAGCPARSDAPYVRADGKVIQLGQEEPAPSSELLQFESLDLVPMRPTRCSLCKCVVDMGDHAGHRKWHRNLAYDIDSAARSADPRLFS